VILLINTLDVDKAALGKFADKVVDAAVQKLQDEPDAYMLTQLIELCDTCDTDVDTIVNDLNISGHNKDKARELQHVMYLKFVKNRAENDGLSENLVNALIKNGWMTTGELSSYNKGRTVTRSGNIYAMGYYEFEIGSDGKIHQRSSKGTLAGLDIFDSVRGLNARYGTKHKNAIEIIDKIDMDSVVDTILTFNAASKKYNGSLYGQDRIMKYLNNEHGITVETMLKIPQALVQWGKENGKDTTELEELIAKAGDKAEKNFPKGLADQLDDAMLKLINS